MKNSNLFFLGLLITILTLPSLEAQYGYGYRNGYGRQRAAIPQADTTPKKEDPLTAEEIVAREMPKLAEALELNEFENAVVSSILTKYVQQSIELRLLKLDADKTREAMEKIRINQKAELQAGLPEDKYEALVKIQQEGYKKKKKEKKKKKKKKSKE